MFSTSVCNNLLTQEHINLYLLTAIEFFKKGVDAKPDKLDKPEEILYKNKRYQECIFYIQSLENFNMDHYITCLIKAYVKMGDYTSARAVINLFIDSKTNGTEGETLRRLNGVIESTQIDEFYIEDKIIDCSLNLENPSYDNDQGCMISNMNIKIGETILIEEPFLVVGKGKCSNCFRNSAFRKCCVNCNNIYFCSEYCRSKDQSIHQWECALYKTKYTSRWMKLVLRVFLKELQTGLNRTGSFVEEINFYNFIKHHPQLKSEIRNSLTESFNLSTYIVGQTELKQLILQIELFKNCIESEFCTKLAVTMLKLCVFCKFKSVIIFDCGLGETLELYSTLNNFKSSCEPNTIISRTSDKIVLKACKDIKEGEEICCSFFDMVGNTTFLDVLLLTEESLMSIMRKKCDYLCRCNKSPYRFIFTYTNNKGIKRERNQFLPPHNKCLLQMIISNTRSYLKSKDTKLLYSRFNIANQFISNKDYILLQGIYFEVIKHEIGLDNFDNLYEYLPIIMNTSYIQFFKRSHMEICSILMHHIKLNILAKLPLSLLKILIDYSKFLEEDVCPCYPNEILLDNVKIMRTYYSFTSDYNNLPEGIPMKASMA